MKWSEFFTSSIGKKFIMGLTGISLILFLVVHVGLNACIFATLFDENDHGAMFNKAAHFMGSNVVPRILEIGLFLGIFLHIIQGLVLEFQNRSKRTIKYAKNYGNRGSKWYSRSMGLLGTIILLFLILHWIHFWIPSRFTGVDEVNYDGKSVHDLFGLMKTTFEQPWVVIVYVLACISLAYHLLHGFQSAFRTMGLRNNKYLRLVNGFGIGFSILVPFVFALMPVSMYFNWVS
jgi:succinate dehydrogenase / fumarate reductase, cytochrome b subunit